MKKRLLIIVSRLLQGGIDTMLIEYLKQFDREKFSIKLAIGTCMEEQEAYIHHIPSDIEVNYLVKRHFLIKYRKQKNIGKSHLVKKTYDETILSPIRRFIQKRNLNKLIAESDVIIDFDSTFYSFLEDTSIPKIAFFHFSFKQYHYGNEKKLRRLGRKLKVYDRIVTICEEMKEEGIEMYPELKSKFITIYNAFDLESIKKKAAEPLNSPLAKAPYILAVQRLEESQKDLTTLIKAYKILVNEYTISEKLYIIGEGKSRKDLENLCKKLGLTERIHFLGLQINPYPWIKHSKLFVFSSKFEGFGIVLIEAMTLDKAIVSTDCSTGPSEILDNGKAGSLVAVGDERGMAEAIYHMLTDTTYQAKMLLGVQRQIKKFDINNTIQQIEELILNTEQSSSQKHIKRSDS
ncbi:glycosyltransferase [Bacteroides sp.]|uniref:glycosyltransferase n=1 Tax=Bacteroides sp. TaxID=29523 RepID=UPI001B5E800E|nr:glycosyltransferase [Bacteroides sp.]MBP6064541.1 glycosyltransferase [Bacteroides sp.]MBP6066702.1 glycosyltransferase [Bacteroides sp.]MBP6935462.1 glycosyltransferase [Bacteroides sp.]MBP9585344.1 glycosyltransferase [Bacteroides sp.]